MDNNPTAKMVAWLDEERRKDKAVITKLEERTASQQALISDQTRRINDLEGQINALRTAVQPVSTIDDTITRLRMEFNTSFEQLESRRSNVDIDFKKLRDTDREQLLRAIEELRQEMITRIEQAMEPRRMEEERLSRVAVELQNYANSLSKGLEDFERSLTFLEEQRRQDTRRISEINSEVAELVKRADGQLPKIELLEELSRRNERRISEIAPKLVELKQQRQEWVEQQGLADQQRERTLNDMVRRMDSFAEDMLTFSKQVQGWADTHRKIKQQVEDFERIADRVERRLNEYSEVQRLSEERFRQEWEEFLGDDQKRWRQFTLTNEEAWRENEKLVETLQGDLARLREAAERQEDHLKYLNKAQQKLLDGLIESVHALRDQAEDGRGSLPALT